MKYAVITGGTRGIGRAITQMFLEKGYTVLANYAHNEESALAFSRELGELANRLILLKEELSSYQAVQSFVSRVLEQTHEIDCLVLNAGVTDRSAFGSVSPENWEHVLQVNLNVPFYLSQAFSPFLKDQVGRMIFIGSLLGNSAYPHGTSISYSVSKAALHQMSRCLVKEFSSRGITVNAIAPGFVDTEWQKEKPADIRKNIEAKTAASRFGTPEEIAKACWAIVENPFINGAILSVDGGYCFR